ncbi:DUF6126 family protein [Streptomyces bohaiensis]|uniref:DUF6126 family protein n=1 Tax=Streptomyces bohaiensis TaxID=1431344 RepID=UPI001ADD716C
MTSQSTDTSGTPVEPAPRRAPATVGHGEERENGRSPRGLLIRLFLYLIGGHVFAGFLYLLFAVGN